MRLSVIRPASRPALRRWESFSAASDGECRTSHPVTHYGITLPSSVGISIYLQLLGEIHFTGGKSVVGSDGCKIAIADRMLERRSNQSATAPAAAPKPISDSED
jgi:hypothetical protein